MFLNIFLLSVVTCIKDWNKELQTHLQIDKILVFPRSVFRVFPFSSLSFQALFNKYLQICYSECQGMRSSSFPGRMEGYGHICNSLYQTSCFPLQNSVIYFLLYYRHYRTFLGASLSIFYCIKAPEEEFNYLSPALERLRAYLQFNEWAKSLYRPLRSLYFTVTIILNRL